MPAAATPRKTLIFHIGDHKTGSTSIQYAFAQKQVRLEGASVFYPAKITMNMLRRHFDAAEDGSSPKAAARAEKAFADLGTRLKAATEDYCLVSAEGFEKVPAATFHQTLKTHWAEGDERLRVIAYARPHAARVMSSFAERVKIGLRAVVDATPDAFFDQMREIDRFQYHPRFQSWRDEFGAAFLLRPMIRTRLREGDVVRDFIHEAFDGRPFELLEGAAANESLCLEDLMRLKVVQMELRKLPPRVRHSFGWEFGRVLATLPPPETRTKLELHKSLAERIRAEYLEDARAMDRDFFGGESVLETELDRACDTARAEPQSVCPSDYLSGEELRSVTLMGRILAGIFENDQVNWPVFLFEKRLQEVREVARAVAGGRTGGGGQGGGGKNRLRKSNKPGKQGKAGKPGKAQGRTTA
ncbi:MAG: hypothetical protein CML02_04860 [Pseudooceanicola sp.]|nr:hypothetical protein [Pseudooceanicola sp.]|tara:strand:- start:963 stop:2204 length:1242 start_codon:yes stop_codon:yes gene_type:complete